MAILRKTFPVGLLQCNCTLLCDDVSKEAVVIDPGDEAPRIIRELGVLGVRVTAIVHTHAHLDHIGATGEVQRATGAPTFLHDGDTFLQQNLAMQAQMIGLPEPEGCTIDRHLPDGEVIRFGAYELGALHTPGHTPGSVCFVVPGQDLCFSGDTLFAGSIGRTDLPGGDFETIERSIKDKLYVLNGAVEVIPGHGPNTHIDYERVTNPFVRG